MALGDRFYMREAYHPPNISTRLIIVLIVAFVVQSVLLFYSGLHVSKYLALSRDGLFHGRVWQLVTFQFLHSTPWPWNVLFNCLGIFFFDRHEEQLFVPRKFPRFDHLCGFLVAILQAL